MSKKVWRIAADTPAYQADDLSGSGAKVTGGRWNEKTVALLYTSQTRALACLETVVHLDAGGLPLNRYLVEITIPTDIWSKAQTQTPRTLKIGWDAEPAGQVSIGFGTSWARSGSCAVLIVPSAIVPEERNILINPLHADCLRISAIKRRKFQYDPRLQKIWMGNGDI